MSFESFIENIEELAVLPTVEKQDGGYFYPEELQGKLYRHTDKLMSISASATDELPISMVEAIYRSIEEGIVDDVHSAISDSSENGKIEELTKHTDNEFELLKQLIKDNQNNISSFKSGTGNMLDGIEEDILAIRSDISTNSEIIKELQNKPQGVNLEMIQKIIDKKFDNAPARIGKIKISTLSMLKESGFSIEEIGELAKNELI